MITFCINRSRDSDWSTGFFLLLLLLLLLPFFLSFFLSFFFFFFFFPNAVKIVFERLRVMIRIMFLFQPMRESRPLCPGLTWPFHGLTSSPLPLTSATRWRRGRWKAEGTSCCGEKLQPPTWSSPLPTPGNWRSAYMWWSPPLTHAVSTWPIPRLWTLH